MAEYPDDEEIVEPIDGEEEEAQEAEVPAAEKLMAFLDSPNLVAELDEQQVTDIGKKAIEGYKRDDLSRAEWKKLNEAGMKLATLVSEQKDTPFAGAANVKAPLITTAALQFNSRAYPALVKGDRVTKCKVNGRDPTGDKAKRADRVSEHSSWQMLSQMPEWEPDTDRLTLIVAITGVVFRKRYWDPTLNRQCSRLVLADRFVYNYKARSIEDCPRISEELYLYPYEIQERIRDGRFIEFEYGEAEAKDGDETDEDSPHLFIEQHRLSDLDGDGYPEPYIVTVHVETEKVCRIVPNFDADSVRVTPEGKIAAIRKRDYYTKYVFFESPDGGAYGMGLGSLMGSTTETVNTLINEMIDAGNLANTQGGFIASGSGLREKRYYFSKGEYKVVNTSMPLNQAIMQVTFPGPSEVLFKLLGLLMEFAKEISATADVMTGDTGGKAMAPTTTLALIEQGMQVFTAVFKRLHRALGRELEMHANLNAKHLSAEDYNAFFDDPQEQYDPKVDYDLKDMNITPVSDPTVATNMQKLAKSQLAREIAGPPGSKPYINYQEIDKRAFEAAEIPDPDGLFAPQQPPDPMAEAVKKLTLQELFEKVIKLRSESIKNVADAESKEAGDQLALLNQFLSTLQAGHAMETQDNAPIPGGPGGLPSMAGPPGNAMGAPPLPPGGNGGGGGAAGPPAQQQPSVDPAAMGGTASPVGAPAGAM